MPSLDEIRQYYRKKYKEKTVQTLPRTLLEPIAKKYYDRWNLAIQGAAAGVAITSLLNADDIDISDLPPQVHEAFELAYPNVPIESLEDAGTEGIAGYVNAWKGKLFEVDTRDRLNAGETVGDIRLAEGQHAEIADSATQSGWDLQILNADGTVATELQLKATDSLAYVKQAIEEHPDIHVLATSDLALEGEGIAGLSFADISEDELECVISEPFALAAETDFLDALLPGLPFMLIATRQGIAIFSGSRPWKEALSIAVQESAKTGVAIGGAGATAVVAEELAGEVVEDIVGDVIADVVLGAVLPFGTGFIIRQMLKDSSPKPKPEPPPRVANENLIRDWVMPRATLTVRSVARHYLPESGN